MTRPATYEDYVRLQTQTYESFESTIPRWEEGQARYLTLFESVNRKTRILDVACGDGVGLRVFRKMGFINLTGVELDLNKAVKARTSGYCVISADFHDLGVLENASYDVVYSSHSLEHAWDPAKAVSELQRVLVPNGYMYVVLPYPDRGPDDAHLAKYELGTDADDGGLKVSQWFISQGFTIESLRFDSYREPEIWLKMRKKA